MKFRYCLVFEIVNALNGKPAAENLRVLLDGPKFYSLVWNALLKIPYGQVASYAEVSFFFCFLLIFERNEKLCALFFNDIY